MAQYIRDLPQLTVTSLMDEIAPPTNLMTVPTASIGVRTDAPEADRSIRVGDAEYPYTTPGLLALTDWLAIPTKFVERLDPDLLDHVVNTLCARNDADVSVAVSPERGLFEADTPNGRRIEPRRVLEVAARTISPDAQIVDWRRDNKSYSFEAIIAPTQAEVDSLAVNDISHGGLRFGQDNKVSSAPWVQPYIYRLVCTNGMEVPDHGLRVSSRGSTMDEVIEELETMAQLAFGRVEADIDAFYELKNEPVINPEKTLTRMALEEGLSDARLRTILETLPAYEDNDGHLTTFDLVNAITNQANDPTLAHRFGTVRTLQQVGGSIAYKHKSRCQLCQSALEL